MKVPAFFLGIAWIATTTLAAVGPAPTDRPKSGEEEAYQTLVSAAAAVVAVKVKSLPDARSASTLGTERSGSGVLIAPSGLVLTIGYLILEADQVDLVTQSGRKVPATVVAYDHATGFGLLRPIGPLDLKPIRMGASARVDADERLMIAAVGGDYGISIATVVSKRPFAGYWEYLLDEAIFTAPPRLDHSGAALINRAGELVGIGSLLVMDAAAPGERSPGNMFVPVDILKPILDEMIATGRNKGGVRPWLGFRLVEDEGRIKVLGVSSEGPAEKAGVRPGDIILAIGGRKVEKLDDLYRRIWSSGPPGVEVPVKLLQGTDVVDLKIRSIDRLEFVKKKPTI